MQINSEHNRFYLALFLISLTGGYCGIALADECDDLFKSSDNKLEAFLHKKLAYEIFSKRQELIVAWKSEYDRFDQVSDELVSATDDVTLENKKIAADQAENSYLKAHSKWTARCDSD